MRGTFKTSHGRTAACGGPANSGLWPVPSATYCSTADCLWAVPGRHNDLHSGNLMSLTGFQSQLPGDSSRSDLLASSLPTAGLAGNTDLGRLPHAWLSATASAQQSLLNGVLNKSMARAASEPLTGSHAACISPRSGGTDQAQVKQRDAGFLHQTPFCDLTGSGTFSSFEMFELALQPPSSLPLHGTDTAGTGCLPADAYSSAGLGLLTSSQLGSVFDTVAVPRSAGVPSTSMPRNLLVHCCTMHQQR